MGQNSETVSIRDGKLEEVLALAFAPAVAMSELIKNASDASIKKNDVIRIDINTQERVITIKDNGIGLSHNDIMDLKSVGFSQKMIEGNELSMIDEPYAGNKGLGIITAFKLCKTLEIKTYSIADDCSYTVIWKKGEGGFSHTVLTERMNGTTLILHDVNQEDIRLLTLHDEMDMLYMSSINYYIDSSSLPSIEIYIDGNLKTTQPKNKIEHIYLSNKKHKKADGFFVAKASFSYSQNILKLTYEDNVKNIYSFTDEIIDLSDMSSLTNFLKSKKITINRYRKSFENLQGLQSIVNDFEGVYYIWRGKKNDEVSCYPYGIRVYVNNYGLYSYLDRDQDWLGHSEITQNKKASNFKLKNTYGYVCFRSFKESDSALMISNERNDFNVNISKKKFRLIMRDFVSEIFSDIDINIKNYDESDKYKFTQRAKVRRISLGDTLNVDDLINTNLILSEVNIDYDEQNCSIDENGQINFQKYGDFKFTFEYDGKILESDVIVSDPTPNFEVQRNKTIDENNSFTLTELIIKKKLRNVYPHQIEISSDSLEIKKQILSPNNLPGEHDVTFQYNKDGYSLARTSTILIKQKRSAEIKKIQALFTKYHDLNGFPKIIELIDGIASCHVHYPILSMTGMRVLTEVLLREFHNAYLGGDDFDKEDKSIISRIQIFNRNAYREGIVSQAICDRYYQRLKGKAGKAIEDTYKEIDMNMYIHNPAIIITCEEFKQNLKKMLPLFNFIIEALLDKK